MRFQKFKTTLCFNALLNFLNNNEDDVRSDVKSVSVNENDFEFLSTKIELLMVLKLTEEYLERLFSE